MKKQVSTYAMYKTYRVFGNKATLPDHLNSTDLQANHPFIMVSIMGVAYSPDLSEALLDYGRMVDCLLVINKHDLEKYFVPANVTTVYKGNAYEWRTINDHLAYHGGVLAIEKRLAGSMMGADRIVQQTVLNVYNQFIREYFTKGSKDGNS